MIASLRAAVAYRTLRVIGRFRFLAMEKDKPGYLHFLPRMARQTMRALASGNGLIAACSALLIGYILQRIPSEERMMRARFGADYDGYAKTTGRLLPPFGAR